MARSSLLHEIYNMDAASLCCIYILKLLQVRETKDSHPCCLRSARQNRNSAADLFFHSMFSFRHQETK